MDFTHLLSRRSAVALTLLATAAAASSPAMAQSVRFEKSNINGAKNKIFLYSVPVIDANGKTKNWDMTISVTPDANGAVPTFAEIIDISKSPKISGNSIVAGTYYDLVEVNKDYDGQCTVTNYALQNGRTQSTFRCVDSLDVNENIDITINTGLIDEAHAYYKELTSAGIDQLADVENYQWGIVTLDGNGGYDQGFSGCNVLSHKDPIGVQQQGEDVRLFAYNSSGKFDCSFTLYAP